MSSHSLNRGVGLRVSGTIALFAALGSAPSARAQASPNGPEFQLNTYTTRFQLFTAVASDSAGNLVAAWMSQGSAGTDTSYFSIQVQRYDGPFRDGFESAGTSRWSTTAP